MSRPATLLAAAALALAALLAPAAPLSAQDGDPFAAALARTQRDVAEAADRLAARRTEISAARIALAAEVEALESEVAGKRRRWTDRQRSLDATDSTLQSLRDRLEDRREVLGTARSLLVEIRRAAGARLDLVDAEVLSPQLAEMDAHLASADDEDRVARAGAEVLGLLADHAERNALLRRVAGRALGPDGRDYRGAFLKLGGFQTFFAAEPEAGSPDGVPAGIVRVEPGSARPHVLILGTPEERRAVADAVAGRPADLPLDVSAGAALRKRETRRTLAEEVRSGGVVMIPILAIGAICLAVGVFKLVRLLRVRPDFDRPLAAVLAELEAKGADAAAARAAALRGPLRPLLAAGIAHRDAPREELEEVLNETILNEVPPLRRGLSVLAVGAAVSPLLGLLGTVTGMIHTFRLIAVFGTGDPRLLSGGISEALVTTEAGLVVAIPLLLLHAFLSRRVRAISESLEKSAVSFLNAAPRAPEGSAA